MTTLRHSFKIALGLLLASPAGCGGTKPSSSAGEDASAKAEGSSDADAEDKKEDATSSEPNKRTYKEFESGKVPVELSGWKAKVKRGVFGRPDGRSRKFVEVSYKLKALSKMKMGDNLTLKATCKVKEQYFADATPAMLAGLDKLEPGETKQLSSGLHGVVGLSEAPEACQISAIFTLGSDNEAYLVGQYCFDGKEIATGPCEGFTPKAPSGVAATILDPTASLSKIKYGPEKGKKDLRVNYGVVTGKVLDGSEAVFMKVLCQVNDEKIVNEQVTAASILQKVDPGEAVLVSRDAFVGKGLASDPAHCELRFELRSMFGSDGDKIGTFCFKDGKVSEGAC